MSVLIFLVVLFLLVLVHEFGHFIVAKFTGMRVDEFGIGFPPKLFGVKKGETEYTFNLFPIGGFVKIYGEDGVTDSSSRALGGDHERSFVAKNRWAQSAVLVAGVTMNVIFAWFLVTIAFSIGVQTSVTEKEASPQAALVVTQSVAGGPAAAAALTPGAVITSASVPSATLSVLTPSAFSTFVSEHGTEPLTIAYRYKGETRMTTISPRAGVIQSEPERAAIGVALTLVDTVRRPLPVAAYDALIHTTQSLRDVAVGIGGLIRDVFRMQADLSQVAGPVGIVNLVGEASAFGFASLLMFTAFISLNLAVINLLPFPALDGGRLLFVLIEAVRGTPIAPRYVAIVNTLGFAFLIILMIAITWHDIARVV